MEKPTYVRVTADDVPEAFSVVESAVEPQFTVLKDEPAADVNGDPLPPGPKPKSSTKSSKES